jgi:hypothetical protein
MDLREIGWDGVDMIGLAQDRDKGELLWMRLWTFGFQEVLGTIKYHYNWWPLQ